MKSLLTTVFLIGGAVAQGQCTFPCLAEFTPVCNWGLPFGPTAVGAYMSFSGTPPYTYHLGFHVGTTTQSSVIFTDSSPNGGTFDYLTYATDANGCTCNLGVLWGTASSLLDIATYTRTFQPNGGNYDLRLTGGVHPMYLGPNALCGLYYALSQNGTPYASGTLASIFNSSISGFVLSSLPAGNYSMTTSINSAGCTTYPYWCTPQSGAFTFIVPQASDMGVNVSLGAGLGGAMRAGGIMIDSLRTDNSIPLTEPYSAAGYVYTGSAPGATIAPSLLNVTGNTAVVDWMVVELRSSSAPYPVLASRPALIRRDGEVIDLDGDVYVNFPGVAPGNYRVSLRHRNHLGVMSGNHAALQQIPVRFNFRTEAAYGTSPQAFAGGVQCLWPGDVSPDGLIRYVGANNDRDPILVAIGGSVPTGVVNNVYNTRDVNMDGSIRYVGANNDRDVILQTIGGSVPTATRMQQLP